MEHLGIYRSIQISLGLLPREYLKPDPVIGTKKTKIFHSLVNDTIIKAGITIPKIALVL